LADRSPTTDRDRSPSYALAADVTCFDLLSGLNDREQRDHPAAGKIDALDVAPGKVKNVPLAISIFLVSIYYGRCKIRFSPGDFGSAHVQ
jgi:hypothetical protein